MGRESGVGGVALLHALKPRLVLPDNIVIIITICIIIIIIKITSMIMT